MKPPAHSYSSFLLTTLGLTCLAALSPVSAQVLAPGNLVVSAYGTPGSSGLIDGQAVPISLQVFTPSVTGTESPTSVTVLSGIVGEYGSSSEGNIQLTGNGLDLTIAGYNATQAAAGIGSNTNTDTGNTPATVGTPYGGTAATGGTYSNSSATPLAQSSPADVARLADVIDNNGNVVSSTSFANIYNTNNARGAYSPDGSSIYISGQGDKTTPQQGIFYSPTTGSSYSGSTTPTGIYNANDTRFVSGYNGNLYYSLDKKNNPTGVFAYAGLPTSGSATATQITAGQNLSAGLGFTLNSYNSPEGFWFANSSTLYVADTGVPKKAGTATGAGGIQKWTLNGSSWQLDYVLRPSSFVSPSSAVSATSGETGFEAITGNIVGNTVDLFAVSYTAADDNANGLYAIADSLGSTSISPGSETFNELATSSGSGTENFKGVAFIATPEPSAWLLGLGALALVIGLRQFRRSPLN